jgi:hypothetical protein
MLFKKKLSVVNKPKEERKPAMATDTNSKFVYTSGADVLNTFKKFGFTPPTDYREDYLFKFNRDANRKGNDE